MAAKQRCVEGEEQDVREFVSVAAAVQKKKEAVPFPSSIYGRSRAEKYLTCDHKSELNRAQKEDADSSKLAGNHERTRRLSASEAARYLAGAELGADEIKQTWYQSDHASDTTKPNKKQQVGGVGLQLRNLSARGGATVQENVTDGVSSPFKELSKIFKIKNPWQKMKSRSKAESQLTPVSRLETPDNVEALSSFIVENTQDLHISSPKMGNSKEVPPSNGSGVEDLSMYLIAPSSRSRSLKAPVNEVHPFAVAEDVPINHTPIIRTTILDDELDRKYERIRALRKREESRRASTSVPKVHITAPSSPPRRKECWGTWDFEENRVHGTDDRKVNHLNEERSQMDLARSNPDDEEDDSRRKANLWNNFF